jgi:hypothetical protein
MLVALSGIADRFASMQGNDYLAGLWRNDLPISLLWKSIGLARRTNGFVAPSFSWASRIGFVTFTEQEEHHKLECSVISASCIPVGHTSTYGFVREGTLSLAGKLVSCTYDGPEVNPSDRSEIRVQNGGELTIFTLDAVEDKKQPAGQQLFCFEIMSYPKVKYYRNEYGIRFPSWDSQSEEARAAVWFSHVLLLKRMEGNLETFQRIGITDRVPKRWFEDLESRIVRIV